MEKKALIVDDDPGILLLLDTVMKREGWTVFQATYGEECLDMIPKAEPDIILLDFNMPGMNGIEVLTRIKEMGSHIPVIVITAITLEELPKDFLEIGAFDFLSKPVKKADIIFSTTKALKHKVIWDRLTDYKKKDYEFKELETDLEKIACGDTQLEMGRFLLLEKQRSFALKELFLTYLSQRPELQQSISALSRFIDSLDKEDSPDVRGVCVSLKNIIEDLEVSLEKTVVLLDEIKLREEAFKEENKKNSSA